MMKLKRCPFCESEVTKFGSGRVCNNPDCPIYAHSMTANEWNTRSIECKLQAALDLEKKKCQEIIDYTCTVADETGWVCSYVKELKAHRPVITRQARIIADQATEIKRLQEEKQAWQNIYTKEIKGLREALEGAYRELQGIPDWPDIEYDYDLEDEIIQALKGGE